MAQKVTDPALLAILNGGGQSAPMAIPLPVSPRQQQQDARQAEMDRRSAALEAERIRLAQQNAAFEREKFYATHNQDGTPKKAPEVAEQALTPDQLAAVRSEAESKIGLLNGLLEKSTSWADAPSTFGTLAGVEGGHFGLRNFGGTSAYDANADVGTIGAAGALTKVMEMAKANGGKNPLTPLSEGDFANIAKSISNLDIGQSPTNFNRNAKTYRDIYRRALRGAGGVDTSTLNPTGGMDALQQGYASLTQQMQGKSPSQRQAMLQAFNADPRIQSIKQRAGFRDPGGRASTTAAPRKSGNVIRYDAQGNRI